MFTTRLKNLSEDQLEGLLLEGPYKIVFPLEDLDDNLKSFASQAAISCGSHSSFVIMSQIQAILSCSGECRILLKPNAAEGSSFNKPLTMFSLLIAQAGKGKSATFSRFFGKPIGDIIVPVAQHNIIINKATIEGIEQ